MKDKLSNLKIVQTKTKSKKFGVPFKKKKFGCNFQTSCIAEELNVFSVVSTRLVKTGNQISNF